VPQVTRTSNSFLVYCSRCYDWSFDVLPNFCAAYGFIFICL